MRMLFCVAAFCAPLLAQSDGFVSLMPKNDVREFWTIEGTPPESWSVVNGIIKCTGKPNGFLRSKKIYKNYIFRAEWRFQTEGWKPGRGGVAQRGILHQRRTGQRHLAGFTRSAGLLRRGGQLFGVRGGKVKGAQRGPFVKDRPPFGSWDKYEITQQDGRIKIVLNGKLVNEGSDAEPSQGNICLQSEGWPVDYRNVAIKELP